MMRGGHDERGAGAQKYAVRPNIPSLFAKLRSKVATASYRFVVAGDDSGVGQASEGRGPDFKDAVPGAVVDDLHAGELG